MISNDEIIREARERFEQQRPKKLYAATILVNILFVCLFLLKQMTLLSWIGFGFLSVSTIFILFIRYKHKKVLIDIEKRHKELTEQQGVLSKNW